MLLISTDTKGAGKWQLVVEGATHSRVLTHGLKLVKYF